jgi:hypothetical protein
VVDRGELPRQRHSRRRRRQRPGANAATRIRTDGSNPSLSTNESDANLTSSIRGAENFMPSARLDGTRTAAGCPRSRRRWQSRRQRAGPKVAPWLIPPEEAPVSAKIRPTGAAPKVCPTSRAMARMPLALPARSGGALARIVRLLGDWKKPNPTPQIAVPPPQHWVRPELVADVKFSRLDRLCAHHHCLCLRVPVDPTGLRKPSCDPDQVLGASHMADAGTWAHGNFPFTQASCPT